MTRIGSNEYFVDQLACIAQAQQISKFDFNKHRLMELVTLIATWFRVHFGNEESYKKIIENKVTKLQAKYSFDDYQKQIEAFIAIQEHSEALIAWKNKMLQQRKALMEALPDPETFEIKRYGYLLDQIQEVKRIGKLQKQISLVESLANFLNEIVVQESLEAKNQTEEKLKEDKELLQRLESQFTRIDIPDDGNCLFTAFLKGLYPNQNPSPKETDQLRKDLAKFELDYFQKERENFGFTFADELIAHGIAGKDEANGIIEKTAPKLRPRYEMNRDVYQDLSTSQKEEWNENLPFKCMGDSTITDYVEAIGDTSMNGSRPFATLREVRALVALKKHPIILYTKYKGMGREVTCFDEGADLKLSPIHIFYWSSKPHFDLLQPLEPS